jgi:hypothetical protein
MCRDALVKFKHEMNGHLDFASSGVDRKVCRRAAPRGDDDADHRR